MDRSSGKTMVNEVGSSSKKKVDPIFQNRGKDDAFMVKSIYDIFARVLVNLNGMWQFVV